MMRGSPSRRTAISFPARRHRPTARAKGTARQAYSRDRPPPVRLRRGRRQSAAAVRSGGGRPAPHGAARSVANGESAAERPNRHEPARALRAERRHRALELGEGLWRLAPFPQSKTCGPEETKQPAVALDADRVGRSSWQFLAPRRGGRSARARPPGSSTATSRLLPPKKHRSALSPNSFRDPSIAGSAPVEPRRPILLLVTPPR